MNTCFLMGKVLNEPRFDFLYQGKNISIAYFWLELKNGSMIKIFGYNQKADFIYRNVQKGKKLLICGKVSVPKQNIEIEVEEILGI